MRDHASDTPVPQTESDLSDDWPWREDESQFADEDGAPKSGGWLMTAIVLAAAVGIGLVSLYGLVRFVKWAWTD